MARPLTTSASASEDRKASESTLPGLCSTASAAVFASIRARPSTGSPRTSCDSCQSAHADRLLITSPTPERRWRTGLRRTKSRSTITAMGICTPNDVLPAGPTSEATGLASPSCARLVATDTIGSPRRVAAYLVTSIVRPPPMPTSAS
jgi:hypothetical protein